MKRLPLLVAFLLAPATLWAQSLPATQPSAASSQPAAQPTAQPDGAPAVAPHEAERAPVVDRTHHEQEAEVDAGREDLDLKQEVIHRRRFTLAIGGMVQVQGAFYVTAMFEPGALGGNQRLPIENPVLSDIVERQCVTAAPDARFVYHLLAAKGICVVPLTGFYSPHAGFRFTLLETDNEKRRWIFKTLAEAVAEYLESDRA